MLHAKHKAKILHAMIQSLHSMPHEDKSPTESGDDGVEDESSLQHALNGEGFEAGKSAEESDKPVPGKSSVEMAGHKSMGDGEEEVKEEMSAHHKKQPKAGGKSQIVNNNYSGPKGGKAKLQGSMGMEKPWKKVTA